VGTPWDARTYDQSSQPQQAWASDVLARLEGIDGDGRILDVGCGTGRVTELLLALVPNGRVLAVDASQEMVALARERLADRAEVWCQDTLDIALDKLVGWSPWIFAAPQELDYVRLNISAVREQA
jgi:trans-aconitate 2-methyltransferase